MGPKLYALMSGNVGMNIPQNFNWEEITTNVWQKNKSTLSNCILTYSPTKKQEDHNCG